MVGSEAFPYAKVGGLSDVLGSLPPALARLGHEVRVILPWYQGIEVPRSRTIEFTFEGHSEPAVLGRAERDGVVYIFIGLVDFLRTRPYGWGDDMRRFVRFSLAAAASLYDLDGQVTVDVVHAHDWHAALIPLLTASGRLNAHSVLTIHNLAFQGLWNAADFFHWTGLSQDDLLTLEKLEFWGQVNLMKGAIACADRVTTVSPNYAREIQTNAYGFNLDGMLRRHSYKLVGIINGIDTDYWDPTTDQYLKMPFSRQRMSGKKECGAALAAELGLEPPIIGMVSRFSVQKGIEIALEAIPRIVELGYSVALLGSGEHRLEEAAEAVAAKHPGRVAYRKGYDEPLAHRIYAGSQIFLVPSRYEPCGLTQMIAMRYGTTPVARATGGLVDTIEDGVTGALFESTHAEGLLSALYRVAYRKPPKGSWARNAMAQDFSWRGPAKAYEELYQGLVHD